MRDVAEHSGVSVQTVSNLVNNRLRQMSEVTRLRIEEAMAELGYHPNLTARGLRSARTATIGFLLLDEGARSLPGTSTRFIWPPSPSFHSTRTHSRPVSLPSSTIARLVCTDQSRATPSSCEDEVRSLSGQSGHTSDLFSFTGGLARISNWVTDKAP